jgi:hypothetical protein
MSAAALLEELLDAGIRLGRDGDDLIADVLPTADFSLHTQRIKAHKSALLSALDLREPIIAAVDVEPQRFNREDYDALWVRWHAHDAKEPSTA